MKPVINLAAERKARQLTEQEAWQAYLDARAKADESQDILDGIAAGKAWREWLERFARIA